MINYLIIFTAVFILKRNLLIFQRQYYDYYRSYKVYLRFLLKPINLIYFLFIFLYVVSKSNFLLIILLSLKALISLIKRDVIKLKFTKRLVVLYILSLLLIYLSSYLINELILTLLLVFLSFIYIYLANFILFPFRKLETLYYLTKAKKKLNKYKPVIIAISGSYGKTSLKHYLASIIDSSNRVLTSKGSYNTLNGILLTINNKLEASHKYLILEIGLDKKGGFNKFNKFLWFDVGIISGIERMHLATFKSLDNIIYEKSKLLVMSKKGFYNLDSNYTSKLTKFTPYSKKDYKIEKEKDYYKLTKEGSYYVKVNGLNHLTNVIGAIEVCKYLKIKDEDIFKGLLKINNVPHRLTNYQINDLLIIDDSYNSNYEGFIASLEELNKYEGKKYLLTCGLLELGKESFKINYKIGLIIASYDFTVVVYKYPNKGLIRAFKDLNYPYVFKNSLKEAMKVVKDKGCVLIENDVDDYYLE